MSRDSIIDYLSYILLRAIGGILRAFPLNWGLFLGKRLGDFLYFFDAKHRAIAYANIKTALSDTLLPYEINKLTRQFFQSFGQNLIEIFFIPLVNKGYLEKYITIEGLENVEQAFQRGKGVILLGVHGGSWELSNIISANVGYPVSMLVRQQERYARVNRLLNSYRMQKGCRLIQRQNQTRLLIELLKKNEGIGMTVDQGGSLGHLVKFFGKNASMATGALRLSLNYGALIIPAIYRRIKGPYIKIILETPYEMQITGNLGEDIHYNLQQLIYIFEKYITRFPQEYLWSYKIWKYTNEKNILILSDGKAGHLRQTQCLVNLIRRFYQEKKISLNIEELQLNYKNNFWRNLLLLSGYLSGRFSCQGCLWCLKKSLKEESYQALIKKKPDLVISCGSALAVVNYLIAQENNAKSMVIMKPSHISTRKFDLVVLPRHDRPPTRKNVVITEGALNLISEEYLLEQSEKLISALSPRLSAPSFYIGLLIGGQMKNFSLTVDKIRELVKELKIAAERLQADILVTTSRRTSREIESLLKEEFKDYRRCKLLIIANEKNIPEAVGGILGLSKIIITSPESISMISEAASSARYVIVFDADGLGGRHRRFLRHLARNKYIYLVKARDIKQRIEQLMQDKPPIRRLDDTEVVRKAVGKII